MSWTREMTIVNNWLAATRGYNNWIDIFWPFCCKFFELLKITKKYIFDPPLIPYKTISFFCEFNMVYNYVGSSEQSLFITLATHLVSWQCSLFTAKNNLSGTNKIIFDINDTSVPTKHRIQNIDSICKVTIIYLVT